MSKNGVTVEISEERKGLFARERIYTCPRDLTTHVNYFFVESRKHTDSLRLVAVGDNPNSEPLKFFGEDGRKIIKCLTLSHIFDYALYIHFINPRQIGVLGRPRVGSGKEIDALIVGAIESVLNRKVKAVFVDK